MSLRDVDSQVLVLAFARMGDSIGNSFLIVVLPLYIASGLVTGDILGLSDALLTGLVLSMFGLFNSIVQPFAGWASDRAGKRKVFVLFGLAVLAVTNAALAFVTGEVVLLVVRILQGVGVAFTIPATLALVNELSSTNTRGGSMGVFNTFRLVGYGIGPAAAGAVVSAGPYTLGVTGAGIQFSGFDAAFYLAALAAFAGFLLVTLFVKESEHRATAASDDLAIAVLADDADADADDDAHLLDPVFTLGLATLFMATGIGLFTTIQPQINAHLDQGPLMYGIEFGVFVVGQVMLQAPVGSASDRYGRRPFIVWGLMLLVPATLGQGLVVAPWQMIAARVLQGVAAAMVFAPALALAGDLAGEGQSGTTLAVLSMAFGLGTALGPLASGFLIRYGYVWPFAFGAVLAAVGTVLVYTQVEETVPTSAADTAGISPDVDDTMEILKD